MKMKIKQFNLLTIAVAVIHFVGSFIFIAAAMENRVPIHFNFAGEADSWSSKWVYLLFAAVPLILAAAYSLYERKADFKAKKNNAKFESIMVHFIIYLFIGIGWCFMLIAWKNTTKLDANLLMMGSSLLLCLILIGISNYLGKIQRNAYFGIRLPWTLKDETVWNRTHRITGYVGLLTGLLLFIWTMVQILWQLIPPFASFIIVLCGVLAAICVFPAFYAYRLYHKLHS